MQCAGCEASYAAKHEALGPRDVINYLLFDPENSSSIYSCLATARRNARAQRTALTREMWESLNSSWVEGLGWVGFDAANLICPTERYVRLASGLDAAMAAPIRGTRRGGETETLDVVVEVNQQVAGQQ